MGTGEQNSLLGSQVESQAKSRWILKFIVYVKEKEMVVVRQADGCFLVLGGYGYSGYPLPFIVVVGSTSSNCILQAQRLVRMCPTRQDFR